MSNYTRQQIENMYGNKVISKAEMEIFLGSSDLALEVENRAQLAKSSQDQQLIEKCASSDVSTASTASHEYSDRVQREQVSIRKQASRDLEEIVKEFESIQRKMVRKAGQTREQQEQEIWQSRPDLFERYVEAQRQLLTADTR